MFKKITFFQASFHDNLPNNTHAYIYNLFFLLIAFHSIVFNFYTLYMKYIKVQQYLLCKNYEKKIIKNVEIKYFVYFHILLKKRSF